MLHGDDWALNGFYRALDRGFADPAVGAAFCRYIAADEEGHWHNLARLEQRVAGVIPHWVEKIGAGQRLQTPSIAVRRSVYEAVGGFDERLAGYAEDWEMWVRIAARYPVRYEPEALAVYRVRSSSMSGRLLRTGENVRKLRLAIDLNAAALPPDRAAAITREARRSTARAALRRRRRLIGRRDPAGMWAQIREAWRTDPSPEVACRAAFVIALRARRAALDDVGRRR